MKRFYQAVETECQAPARFDNALRLRMFWLMLVSIAVVLFALIGPFAANALTQRCFDNPQQAVDALIDAVRHDDEQALLALFGADADNLISSGDPVADQRGRDHFLTATEQKIALEEVDETRRTVIIGERNYPFPIPLVLQNGGWRFDTPAGIDELLNRRIGRNELHTIKVLNAYNAAQREYAAMMREEGVPVFARYLASHDGAKDGLYWPQEDDLPESPFGPLIAKATAKGYHSGEEGGFADPFFGYYYTILTAQGSHAEGGAFDYIVNDKMVLGFALIAYPAKYGASGIMTFMINQSGQIYEKDLGPETAAIASAVTAFDPDSSWQLYREPAGESAR
jgi:hypothetical protein